MGRRSVCSMAVLSVVSFVACSSHEEVPPKPIDVQIDTLNVGLAGAGVAGESERRGRLLAELAKLGGDILCLQEVWQESDKVAFQSALAAHYPHAVWPKTDRTTKLDVAVTPPVPKTAPCAGHEAELDQALACITDRDPATTCVDAAGKLTTTACVSDKCLADVVPLLGADDQSCYTCLVSNMVSEKLDTVGAICKAPGLGLGFGGQASEMLLSKHPLTDVTTLVVPGCWQQRTVVHATATLDNGAMLDVYCNHLSPVNFDELLPYACPWDGGETKINQRWEAEQKLQIDAILAFAKTAKHRVVFLGDLNASPTIASPPAREAAIQGYGGYVLDSLGKVFVEAVTSDYVPACTFCESNALVSGENTWLDHVFLGGIDRAHVKSTSRTFDVAPALSDHYGMRAVVTVDPE